MSTLSEKLKPGNFLRTGHRGAAGLAPENTMASFQKAAETGVDLIELDVQSTSDGQIVVLHDSSVDRTTDGAGEISHMTYETARRLDAGFRFAARGGDGAAYPFRGKDVQIPLLEEVLASFPDMGFTVEIKSSPHPKFFENLAAIVRSHAPNRVIIASEAHEPLETIRKFLPGVPTNLSRPEVRRFYFMAKFGIAALFRSAGSVFQVPIYAGGESREGLRVVTKGFLRAAHRGGRTVQVWTINDPGEMNEIIDLGVDGITTDRPDRLNEVLKTRRANA